MKIKYACSILISIFVLIASLSYSQKGKYSESGADTQSPLTTFSKKDGPFLTQLSLLKNKIKNDSAKLFDIYTDIYSDAILGLTNNSYAKNQNNPNAVIVRNAAFCALVGLKYDSLTNTIDTMDASERLAMINKALTFFTNENYFKCNPEWFETGGFGNDGKVMLARSIDLGVLLEAYELLKAINVYGIHNIGWPQLDRIRGIKGRISQKNNYPNLQKYTRNLYNSATQFAGVLSWKDNITLITASSLGMAAIVLHDASVKSKIRTKWRPDKWIETANWHINRTMWTTKNYPLSRYGEISGFSEGPSYFIYAFNNLMPYFLTHDNFVPDNFNRGYSRPGIADIIYGKEHVKNFFDEKAYENLYQWATDIVDGNGNLPSYDDSGVENKFQMVALYRKSKYNVYQNYLSIPSYLAALPKMTTSQNKEIYRPASGNFIFKSNSTDPLSSQHYLHLLAEPKTARSRETDKLNDDELTTHEHPDMGNIIMQVGNNRLLIDPEYGGFENRAYTNKPDHHNVIGVHDDVSPFTTHTNADGNADLVEMRVTKDYRVFDLKYHFYSYEDNTAIINYVHRKVERFTDESIDSLACYYVITDRVSNSTNNNYKYSSNFSGLGTMTNNSGIITWEDNSNTWGLQLESTVYNNSYLPIRYDTYTQNHYGSTYSHPQLRINTVGNKITFQNVFRPYKKPNTLSSSSSRVDDYYTSHLVSAVGKETRLNFHFAKNADNINISISDPFEKNDTSLLLSDAHDGFLSFAPNNYTSRDCIANTKFRKAGINHGKYLKYGKGVFPKYISTENPGTAELDTACFNKNVSSHYQLVGKFKYTGFTETMDTGFTAVTYYLPDLETGYSVVARKGTDGELLTSNYMVLQKSITILFEQGLTYFTIELEDPCLLSCFFAPSGGLDSTFVFSEGTKEILAHDLEILDTSGHLIIENAGIMSICPDYTLINRSKITLIGKPDKIEESFGYGINQNENGYNPSIDTIQLTGRDTLRELSKIIVNNNAGLILEEGSITKVGRNGMILVKQGGTLLIKNGAKLILGSKETEGFGSVIIESGAYICVEEGAEIEFYATNKDSIDDNIFYITIKPLLSSAIAGTNPEGCQGKFLSGQAYGNSNCIDICAIKNALEDNTIRNPEFGWSNIMLPVPTIKMKSVYCSKEFVQFACEKTLNEVKYKFIVYDETTTSSVIEELSDANFLYGRIGQRPIGVLLPGEYKVRLIVVNDCDEIDSIEHFFMVKSEPVANFVINEGYCTGYENVIVNSSNSSDDKHVWIVEKLNTNSNANEEDEFDDYVMDWSFNSFTSSTFNFPGYNFNGGKYLITLIVTNECGQDSIVESILDFGFEASILVTDKHEIVYTKSDTIIYHYDMEDEDVYLYGENSSGNGAWYNTVDGFITNNHTLIISNISKSGTYIYIYEVEMNGCYSNDTIVIIVNTLNKIVPDPSSIICETDGFLKLHSYHKNIPGAIYRWYPGDLVSDSTDTEFVFAYPDTSDRYFYLKIESGSTVEIDKIRIIVDSICTPDFNSFSREPFEICFENTTMADGPKSTYLWDFGDGSSDATENPCHQFVSDTGEIYTVCLTVTNSCGFWTKCDTILFNNTNGYERIVKQNTLSDSNNHFEIIDQKSYLFNTPNPFDNTTVINYNLLDNQTGLINVYDMLGKAIKKIPVNNTSNKILVSFHEFNNGIYNYQLVTENGKVLKSNRFAIIK